MIKIELVDYIKEKIANWTKRKYLNLAIFNALLLMLVLLRSAGYFSPYLTISINLIVFLSLVTSVFILGARSSMVFLIAFLFWVFAALLKVLNVDVWAERTVVYVFEAVLVGFVLLLVENTVRD